MFHWIMMVNTSRWFNFSYYRFNDWQVLHNRFTANTSSIIKEIHITRFIFTWTFLSLLNLCTVALNCWSKISLLCSSLKYSQLDWKCSFDVFLEVKNGFQREWNIDQSTLKPIYIVRSSGKCQLVEVAIIQILTFMFT